MMALIAAGCLLGAIAMICLPLYAKRFGPQSRPGGVELPCRAAPVSTAVAR